MKKISEQPQELVKLGKSITDLAKKDPGFRRAVRSVRPEKPVSTKPEEEFDEKDVDPNILRSLERAARQNKIKIPESLKSLELKFAVEKMGILHEDFDRAIINVLDVAKKNLNEEGYFEFEKIFSEMAVLDSRKFVAWIGINDPILTEKYMGFEKLKKKLNGQPDIEKPGALAAWIGRKKYGKSKFQKAAGLDHKLESKNTVNEKWGVEIKTPKSEKGKYSGKTIEELKSMRMKLKNKKDRTKKESSELKEINFALRAKSGWGKVPK